MALNNGISRLHTSELELGVSEATQEHIKRSYISPKPVTQRKLDFEHARPRWLREMAAEATGVFFYVYPGIAAVAAFTLNKFNPGFGSIFAVGCAFALGIAFAIITCAPVSGGHFNPAITICLAIWQGFPWKKVPYYIFSQIFGSFMAGLFVMGQYHEQISAFTAASVAAGKGTVYNGGPASILCTFPNATQNNLGYLFFNEFFVCTYIGIVIWACLDPANPFIAPAGAPFVIGLVYAAMASTPVWGFADIAISTNLARDLGTRFVAAIFFGKEAFSYKDYSWISILVNIPATVLATGFYELLMRDSIKRIAAGGARHEDGEEGLQKHLMNTRYFEQGMTEATVRRNKGTKTVDGDQQEWA